MFPKSPPGDARSKSRDQGLSSEKHVCLCKKEENFTSIHLIVVEIFESGPQTKVVGKTNRPSLPGIENLS